MDTLELSKHYMQVYDKLISDYRDKKISDLVSDLNDAISRKDMVETERLYNMVMEWNNKVSKIEGARIVLDAQFHYLHLPSSSSFDIIFDSGQKIWRFNTEMI